MLIKQTKLLTNRELMYALFKKSIRTRLDWWTPAAVTSLSIFSVGMWGRYYMKWICVNWLCHRKSFSGHWCIFVVLGFYSLMYDGILQMFPLKEKHFNLFIYFFFSKGRPAVVQEAYKSHLLLVSHCKMNAFWCKRPSLPATCLSCIEK